MRITIEISPAEFAELPATLLKALGAATAPEEVLFPSLSPRERDVVQAVVDHPGAKSIALAENLKISEHTLHNYLGVIYQKLRCHSRVDLYALATGRKPVNGGDSPRVSAGAGPVH